MSIVLVKILIDFLFSADKEKVEEEEDEEQEQSGKESSKVNHLKQKFFKVIAVIVADLPLNPIELNLIDQVAV